MSDEPQTLLECWKLPDSGPVYTVILSYEDIRYIRAGRFINADVEGLIEKIKQLSPCPVILHEYDVLVDSHLFDAGMKLNSGSSKGKAKRPAWSRLSSEFARLFDGVEWDTTLRLYHNLGRMKLNQGLTTSVYYLFHSHLALGKKFGFAECLEAWVKGTEDSRRMSESYEPSAEHIVCYRRIDSQERCCVFRKTDFVMARLLSIGEEATRQAREVVRQAEETLLSKEREVAFAEEKKGKEDVETLSKSRFDAFVYIMEDSRNNTFKIGRSRTPHKRESTLQSEVSETVLRFAIPADQQQERRLHSRFDPKRKRGEWFHLTADDLLWIVSFLKKRGDVARAFVDYEWLAKTFLASAKYETE